MKSYSKYKNKEKVKKVKYDRPTQYDTKHSTSPNTKDNTLFSLFSVIVDWKALTFLDSHDAEFLLSVSEV